MSVLLALALMLPPDTRGMLIDGWSNNSFIGRRLSANDPSISELMEQFGGLYYQWDMGIQCKFQAGLWHDGTNVNFWTTYDTVNNVERFRLELPGLGPITLESREIRKHWDNWPENVVKKFVVVPLVVDKEFRFGRIPKGVAMHSNGKLVPLDFHWARYFNSR
jgi:hypothetical protein